jgi:hypothetical protein
MRRIAALVVVLMAVMAASGCVQEKYEEGKEKRQEKADKMVEENTE